MHGGFASGLIAPVECAVRKLDANALAQHPSPQHTHLLALGDAVGGHKCAAAICLRLHIASGLHVPSRHKVQQPRVVDAFKNEP